MIITIIVLIFKNVVICQVNLQLGGAYTITYDFLPGHNFCPKHIKLEDEIISYGVIKPSRYFPPTFDKTANFRTLIRHHSSLVLHLPLANVGPYQAEVRVLLI